eukprot:gene6265-8629_t
MEIFILIAAIAIGTFYNTLAFHSANLNVKLFPMSMCITNIDIIFSDNINLVKICRICKKRYNPNKNYDNSCKYHKGRWMGAENSKHLGTRSGGKNTGLSLFWDCCDENNFNGIPCASSKHISYDD